MFFVAFCLINNLKMIYKSTISEFKLKKINTDFKKEKISSAEKAQEYARKFYGDDLSIYESFFLILLNQSNNTIGFVKISQGGISSTVVDPLIIAKYAIDSLAKNIILLHNHPSGELKPSEVDKIITDKIIKGLKLFDVRVLDHIILTENDFYSFADNGILTN